MPHALINNRYAINILNNLCYSLYSNIHFNLIYFAPNIAWDNLIYLCGNFYINYITHINTCMFKYI